MPISSGMAAARGTGGGFFGGFLDAIRQEKTRRDEQDAKLIEGMQALEKMEIQARQQQELEKIKAEERRETIKITEEEKRKTKRMFPSTQATKRLKITPTDVEAAEEAIPFWEKIMPGKQAAQRRFLELQRRQIGQFFPEEAIAETTEMGELPQGITEEDIQFTMQKHGLTREEVLQQLGR